MGNGPGGLVEYIDMFRTEPQSQGGLVWEWSNHGILREEGNVSYYAYGGDFGDEPNDGDFIMDGLTLSDHTPMPSLREYAKVIQPVSVKLAKNGSAMTVVNYYDFLDLSHLDVTWHLVADGLKTEPQPLSLPKIAGGENRTLALPSQNSTWGGESWITVELRLKEDAPWAPNGHLIAWDQLHIKRPTSSTKNTASLTRRQEPSEFQRNGTKLSYKSGDATFGFDLLQGNVTWNINGVDVFQRGPELSFYRALTQNDASGSGDGPLWDKNRISMIYPQIRDVS